MGQKRENTWKTTWHTHNQNLAYLTCALCGARTIIRHSGEILIIFEQDSHLLPFDVISTQDKSVCLMTNIHCQYKVQILPLTSQKWWKSQTKYCTNITFHLQKMNTFLTNGFAHHYRMGESTSISKGIRIYFKIIFHFSINVLYAKRIAPDGTPHSAASQLALYYLPMSHKYHA